MSGTSNNLTTAAFVAVGGFVPGLDRQEGFTSDPQGEPGPERPAAKMPVVVVGQRYAFDRQPNLAKPHRHTGVWQAVAGDVRAIQFQQVSKDGTRLIARKTTKLTIDQVQAERDAGRIVPVA